MSHLQDRVFPVPTTHLSLKRKAKFSCYGHVKTFFDMLRLSSTERRAPDLYVDSSLLVALDKGSEPERVEAFKHLLTFTTGFFPSYRTTICLPVFFEYSRKKILNQQEFHATRKHIEEILRSTGVRNPIIFDDCSNYIDYVKSYRSVNHDLKRINEIVDSLLSLKKKDLKSSRGRAIFIEGGLHAFTPTSNLVSGLKYLDNKYFSFFLSFKIGRLVLPIQMYHKKHRPFMIEYLKKERSYTSLIHRTKNFADFHILSRADIRRNYASHVHTNIFPVTYDEDIRAVFFDRSNRFAETRSMDTADRHTKYIDQMAENNKIFDSQIHVYYSSLLQLEANREKGLDYFKLLHLLCQPPIRRPEYGTVVEFQT